MQMEFCYAKYIRFDDECENIFGVCNRVENFLCSRTIECTTPNLPLCLFVSSATQILVKLLTPADAARYAMNRDICTASRRRLNSMYSCCWMCCCRRSNVDQSTTNCTRFALIRIELDHKFMVRRLNEMPSFYFTLNR